MTVPGVRVTPVRRTVTVAVALVTGQALLCGIIGFVTFGGQNDPPPSVRAAEPPPAGPPVALPPAGPPSRGAAPTEKRATPPPEPARTSARRSPVPARSSSTRSVAPATSAPGAVVAPEPPPGPISLPSGPAFLPTTPPAGSDDENGQPPAVEKERCDVEGATAETAEGRSVRCERDRDGELRWRLV